MILNADVRPAPDFLQRLIRHYEDGGDYLLVQSRVANQESVLPRYVEAVHQHNYPNLNEMLWTEGFSCRRGAAIDVGLFPDGFPLPLTAGEDASFGGALAQRYRKAVDPSIVVVHVVPPRLRDFWKERISRGRATPLCKHYLMGRFLGRIAVETAAKAVWWTLLLTSAVGVLRKAGKLSRHSTRGAADLLPFAGATVVEWVGQIVGEVVGLFQIARVRTPISLSTTTADGGVHLAPSATTPK